MYRIRSISMKKIMNTEKYCRDSGTRIRKHMMTDIANPNAVIHESSRWIPEKQKQNAVTKRNMLM